MARSAAPAEARGHANMSALLTLVHRGGAMSRAELTAALGLNRSTIGELTARLAAAGLVREESPELTTEDGSPRKTGRPSLVVIPTDQYAVLAVSIDVDRVKVALVGLGGEVLQRSDRLHQRGQHEVDRVVEAVTAQCRAVLEPRQDVHCIGAGVAVPGLVRRSDGVVRFAPNLGWVDAPFTELMRQSLGMPVVTDNDASLGVVAEWTRGAAVGYDDVAYVDGSTGVGGGFLVGGQVLRGAMGFAGEIGHLPMDPNGDTCRCGSIGCWETKVGEDRLLTDAGRLPGGGPAAVAEVVAAADAGDRRAAAAVEAVAGWVGQGLDDVLLLFDPEVVVLSGVLRQVWDSRPDVVTESMRRASRIAYRNHVVIRSAGLRQDSALIGAAEAALEPLLHDPVSVVGAASLRRGAS